jgi:phosphatidylserine decarboxylase
MATVEPRASFTLVSAKPTSIQPGGGFCVSLERAWGRLRRGYLRLFRPAYVQRMLQKRQGSCPGCPHDIIDSRDLKLYRNVCGYWFRSQDDPFIWRNQLRLARPGLVEVVCFTFLVAPLTALFGVAALFVHLVFLLPLVACLVLWLFVISFFRDPERKIPSNPDALVSPADGTITHIGEVDDADFPGDRAFRISIFLSVFNVHVNRAPRTGRVVDIRYFPGGFLDARHDDCPFRNEQLWVDLEENPSRRFLRVKQISGAIARRIVCWLKPGEEVKAGDRFGMIKFGSRTDVLLPADEEFDLNVKVGDKVNGGISVLVTFKKPGQAPA